MILNVVEIIIDFYIDENLSAALIAKKQYCNISNITKMFRRLLVLSEAPLILN